VATFLADKRALTRRDTRPEVRAVIEPLPIAGQIATCGINPKELALARRPLGPIRRMVALVGFVGVLVGWAAQSGYSHWATRRGELGAARVATALLGEELGRADDRFSVARVAETWADHRAALVQHFRPADYRRLAAGVEMLTGDAAAASREALNAVVADLDDAFWQAHQAFIATALVKILMGRMLSKQLHAVIESSRLP
jgi:hypothetical protein